MWPALVATFAFSAGQSILGSRQRRAQRRAENRARQAANLQTVLETAQSVNTFNRQGMELQRQSIGLTESAQGAHASVRGRAEVVQGAAGLVGASVDAVLNDIDRELSRAELAIEADRERGHYNLVTQLRSTITSAERSIHQLNPTMSDSQIFQQAAVAGALSAGQTYASTYFTFDTGG